jgi:hypothetical protein
MNNRYRARLATAAWLIGLVAAFVVLLVAFSLLIFAVLT